MIEVKNKIIIKNYNIKDFNFYKYFFDILKKYTQELDLLHNHLPKHLFSKEIVKRENDQKLPIHKILYKIDDGYDLDNPKENSGFLNLFDRFVLYLSKNVFNEHLIYQRRPTIRVNFPNNKAVGTWHRDSEYNHPLEEINIWIPITNSINTNAIWIESEFDKNDFKPINTKYGEYIIFDSGLKHGNQINIENKTRISFDFRIVPKSLYKNNPNTSSINTNMKFKVGEYYKSTEEL